MESAAPSPNPLRQRAQVRTVIDARDWNLAGARGGGGESSQGWRVHTETREGMGFERASRGGRSTEWATIGVITAIAAGLRIFKFGLPAAVAFDEVHFGVFTSYYVRREYFFDVHPPLAKLLLALAAWFVGYDGQFEFESIGDTYVGTTVPYVGLRVLPAVFGSLIPPLIYATMRESGCSVVASILSTSLVLIDNAHVVQTRFMLLDGPLIFFLTAAVYSYIRFSNLKPTPFTRQWWTWLCLAGASLSATISCKMVGLFTFFTIGSAVALDLAKTMGLRLRFVPKAELHFTRFTRNFAARFLGLVILPAALYLVWFWVHFAILTQTGTGDDFMSVDFQRTLVGNPLLLPSEEIRYFDKISLRNKWTKAFLHAPLAKAGESDFVSAFSHADAESEWIVEPTKELPPFGRGRIVRQKDIITLRHVASNETLASAPGASPFRSRFTTVADDEPSANLNSTHFRILIDEAHDGQQWLSKVGPFSLIHVPLEVAIVTRRNNSVLNDKLDVSGSRHLTDDAAVWLVDDIIRPANTTGRPRPKEKPRISLPFWRKFVELQRLMLEQNAEITDEHPYTSHPSTWPFLFKGISFWTGPANDRSQVYMTGNPVGWWLCVGGLASFPLVLLWDVTRRKRSGIVATPVGQRQLYSYGTLFFLGWMLHYLPFFFMHRQRFLHHYLPAHLFSALLAGSLFDFLTSRARLSRRAKFALVGMAIVTECVGFAFIAPLTYGLPLPSAAAVTRRKLFATWIIHHTS